MIFVPLLLLAGGGAIVLAFVLAGGDDFGPVPDHKPDLVDPPVAKLNGYDSRWGVDPKTGKVKVYKLVDNMLSELRKASESSGIPLGLLVGWIAKESGGKLGDVTRLDERGVFQLMKAESDALGVDHLRLSTDLVYSIGAGLQLIAKYMKLANKLSLAPQGSEFFWRLVKLFHTMGTGSTNVIVKMARTVGEAGSWRQLENFAVSHEKEVFAAIKKATGAGHSPSKWFPLVDAVVQVGQPFGFGAQDTVVGAAFSDIIDPLDCL